jgi:hypothetical protein
LERTIEFTLPVSVRFRSVAAEDVDELDIEISGAEAGLRVAAFSPTTRLASDVAGPIKSTTTTKKGTFIDGSLGGTLPIPYADLVAHLTPTINAGAKRTTSETESLNRLPPQRAIVISGTSSEGRGVFFKLKRSSQTSLEGAHELVVSFVVPADWRGCTIRVSCTAHGQRKVLWVRQPATLGHEVGEVRLRRRAAGGASRPPVDAVDSVKRPSRLGSA